MVNLQIEVHNWFSGWCMKCAWVTSDSKLDNKGPIISFTTSLNSCHSIITLLSPPSLLLSLTQLYRKYADKSLQISSLLSSNVKPLRISLAERLSNFVKKLRRCENPCLRSAHSLVETEVRTVTGRINNRSIFVGGQHFQTVHIFNGSRFSGAWQIFRDQHFL